MAYFGPHSRFGELMGSPEARAVIDKYMQGATPYLTPDLPMMDMALQRIVSSFPPEVGKAFISEIEQCKPNMLHGGQILARALKQEGVDTVFTLSGDHTMAMYYGLVDEGIKVIDHRHESAAVLAANGYARASGKPGVVIITAGPGAANAFGGLIDGVQGDVPMLVISGGCPVASSQTGAMQEFDLIPTFRGVCNWAERVYKTDRIADYVHIAFRELATPPMGPAFLEIPYDVLNDLAPSYCARERGITRVHTPILPDPASVDAAVEILAQAKKPVVVVGRESRFYPENLEYAGKLAEYLNAPVYSMWETQGFFGKEDDPRYAIGPMATSMADVILTFNLTPDYMYSFMLPPAWNPYAKIISVNVNPKFLGFNRDLAVGMIATPGDAAKLIYEKYTASHPATTDGSFLQEMFGMAAQMADPAADSDASPVNPKRACKEIKAFIAAHSDWGVVVDGGDNTSNMSGFACSFPAQYCYESRFGGIGTALPMAIGAHYADGRKMLMVTGDGSMGFYLSELTTAIKRKVPLVIAVMNDSTWGMITGMEHAVHPNVLKKYSDAAHDGIALHLGEIHYEKICEALGGYGEFVTKAEDILPALERAEKSGKVALINITTGDQTEPGVMGMATSGYGAEFKPMVKF